MSGTDLVWNTSDTRVQVCDVAVARPSAEGVVLSFGAREMDDHQVQAFTARLLRSIALRPESARHLRDMLAQALADGREGRAPNG